jgi:uncharacterized oligopeptide transporter (OPT) family protein
MPAPKSPAPYREVTPSSVIFGIVCGGVMNAALTYAGLKIGFTIVGSAIAAVLGFGVLRGFLRPLLGARHWRASRQWHGAPGSILEINIVQTIASGVNTTSAGVIFTVPVLMLLGHKLDIHTADFWLLTLASMVGAVLGVIFIIPLRKQMIEVERLRFPSGTAVAAILKSPGAGPAKSIVLVAGAIIGALIYAPSGLPLLKFRGQHLPGYASLNWRLPAEPAGASQARDGSALSLRVDRDRDGVPDLILQQDRIDIGRALHLPDQVQLVFGIAPFAIGAGYIAGRAGLMVLAGGLLAYCVLNPLAFGMGWMPQTVRADQAAGYAVDAFNRPLGIGLLLGGAMMGILAALPAMVQALRSLAQSGAEGTGAKRDEMSLRTILLISGAGMLALLLILEIGGAGSASAASHDATGVLHSLSPWLSRALIALIGGAWIWFAGLIIAQCTGMTDWSPISGMALLTVLLVMVLGGKHDLLAAVMVGSALCVALACAADMMADLKTGQLVGASPRKQQWVQLTAALGPPITMATLLLIASVNMKQTGVAIGPGTPTAAPQAQALRAVIEGVQGGEMPYALYGLGAVMGCLLGVAVFPGLGVLVGLSMYLPVHYIMTYGIGCVASMVIARVKGKTWAEDWGVPLAAGLIVGETMLALVVNVLVLTQG